MYVITGGAGFIGSALISALNREGISDILVVDELTTSTKWKNLRPLSFLDYQHKDDFLRSIEENRAASQIKAIVHLGAISSTSEMDVDLLMRNNYRYTRTLAEYAVSRGIRYLYASSAATYGDGAQGYSDDPKLLPTLRPMNPYGYSKQIFDLYALRSGLISKMVGLKFFNVFGPNEYHKGDMRSVVLKAYNQIRQSGTVTLFKSHHPDYQDGEQKRDFVYVKDCCTVITWLLKNSQVNGIFNLGSGMARSWNDLTNAVFAALGKRPSIEYIDMPIPMRTQYQYFTQAQMDRLAATGCPTSFSPLESSVADYVQNYLAHDEKVLE